MKAQDIYHNMRAIAEDYHAYTDQLTAIAKWIEAEFEYKPQNLANGVNKSERQLIIPDVIGQSELLLAYLKYQNSTDYKPETRIDKEVEKFLSQQ